MNRRELLTRSVSVLVGSQLLPLLRAATLHTWSTRATALVAQSNVIDMLSLLTLNWNLLDRWQQVPGAFTEADFQKLRSSGINVFHPAVALETPNAHAETLNWFNKWNRFITAQSKYFVRIDGPQDLTRAKAEGRIGIIFGMQDANHLRAKEDVDFFHAMGQRLMQLTYNGQNTVGTGCMLGSDKGLTQFGHDVIDRMNSIGMAIDISHCGERTSLDAIAASKKPVLITHSNCKSLAPGVARCKSDEVIKAAANSGGVLGITSVRNFVNCKGKSTVEDVLDHFDHAVQLVGIDHVGLGSDFDLDAHPTYDTPGLNHCGRIYELTEGLIRRKYTDAQITQILGGNFQRALQQIWS